VLYAAWLVVPAVAVTRATSARPRSASLATYVAAVAPAIATQTRPFSLQRNQA
jgi:hypothetical protein